MNTNLFNKKAMKSILYLIFMSVFSINAYAIEKAPKGERIDQQTFKAKFKHFKDVMFASYNDYEVGPAKVHFYLLRDDRIVFEFPDFYINSTSWSFEGVAAVSFKDVNMDGLKDVIIIAEYVTGIGPTGMVPFLVKGVYFQEPGKFSSNEKLNKLLSSSDNYSKLTTISSIVKYLKNIDLKNIERDSAIE